MSATEAPGVPKAMPEGRRLRHPRFQDARIGLNLRAKGESPKKIFLGQFFLMVRSTNGVPFNLAQQPCNPAAVFHLASHFCSQFGIAPRSSAWGSAAVALRFSMPAGAALTRLHRRE
jgi:hypothetical protein